MPFISTLVCITGSPKVVMLGDACKSSLTASQRSSSEHPHHQRYGNSNSHGHSVMGCKAQHMCRVFNKGRTGGHWSLILP